MTGLRVLVTCEHGGNRIPARYRRLFAGHEAMLESHRGHDPGALALARDLSRTLRAPLVAATVSRLLVELNRSPRHPRLYSNVTRVLDEDAKRELLADYYLPYRHRIEALVTDSVRAHERVLHVSSHSFTPTLDGVRRNADIGLLYDPSRTREVKFCDAWQDALRAELPGLVVRRNYPYRGTADGLTTHLRRRFGRASYLGIEIEVNQKHALGDPSGWAAIRRGVVRAFETAVNGRSWRQRGPVANRARP